MAVIVNKEDDKNNALAQRISADLRERAERKSGSGGAVLRGDKAVQDFADDVAYMRDFKKTGKFGWVWILLVVLGLVILIGVGVSF